MPVLARPVVFTSVVTHRREELNMFVADITICTTSTSQHSVVLSTTATTDPSTRLVLEPGDCYTTSNGERVRILIANPYQLDKNGDGVFAKRVHRAGTYAPKAYKTTRTVTIAVR